jgi:Fic family protein
MMNAAKSMATRAGRYVAQPAGYRAFIPAPLPPDPAVDLGGRLRESLSGADYALGRLDGSVLTLPNPDLFVFMYVRKEAVLSSQIEGTLLRTREDCRSRIADQLGRAASNGHRVMERLFDHPIITVSTVRTWLGMTQAGANVLVNRLVRAGILREITGYARNRRFRFDPYLKLFEEPEERPA